MIWFERKIISDLQNRIGPNRAGPFGILQTLADGIKLFFKEEFIPREANKIVFHLAPTLAVIPAEAKPVAPKGGPGEAIDAARARQAAQYEVQLDPLQGPLAASRAQAPTISFAELLTLNEDMKCRNFQDDRREERPDWLRAFVTNSTASA